MSIPAAETVRARSVARAAVADGLPRIAARELLKYAVTTAILSPYGGGLLDVRRAVLIDGSDFTRADGKAGTMIIMTAGEFDMVIENVGGLDALKEKLGHDFAVYDGRKLL
jgi:hypothetical protein